MKVMVIVKATQRSEAGLMPDEKLLTEMGNYNNELADAGILISAEGLHPSSKGARVKFSGANRTVDQGPFSPPNELVAGFWVWRVNSMEEAIEWVKRCPNPMPTDCEIEIRPVVETEDLGQQMQPELREQEAAIRAEAVGLSRPRFENGKDLIIAGMKQTYMFVSRSNIPSQWERFAPHIGRIPGQVGKAAYGVCSSYKGQGGFNYMSGVEVTSADDLPSEYSTLTISPQRYAVFAHEAHVSEIPNTIDRIWNKWLPDSGLKAADSPCYERYTEKFDSKTGTGGMEIWVPLQR